MASRDSDTVGVCGSLGEASSRKPQPAAHTAWDGKRGDGQIVVVFFSFFSQFISISVAPPPGTDGSSGTVSRSTPH